MTLYLSFSIQYPLTNILHFCIFQWAETRTSVEIDNFRENYLSLASKRKRLQLRLKGTGTKIIFNPPGADFLTLGSPCDKIINMTLSTQSITVPLNENVQGNSNTHGDKDELNSSSPQPSDFNRASRPLLRPPSSARLLLSLPLPPAPSRLTGPTGPTGIMKGAPGTGTGVNAETVTRALNATHGDTKRSMSSSHLSSADESSVQEKEKERGRGYSSATLDGRRQNTEESSLSDSDSYPRPSIFNSTSNGSSTYVTPTKSSDGRDGIQGSRSDGGCSTDVEREKEKEKEMEMRRAGVFTSNSNDGDTEEEEMKAERTATSPKLAALQSPSRSSLSIPLSPPPMSPESLDRRKALRRSFTDPSGLGLDGSRIPSTLSPPGIISPASPSPAGETAVSRRLHAAAAARKLAEENGGYSPLPPPRSLHVSPKETDKH